MTEPLPCGEDKKKVVTIKKYANRRLYNTDTSSYVTLENLAVLVKEGTEFRVVDAKTGEDLTRSVLTQIIVEEEGKLGQQNLLPIGFLRQLIGFYGDNMQWMVPKYLEQSLDMLTNHQKQMSGYFQTAFGKMLPFSSTLEEMSKQNMVMFDRAMKLFTPFVAPQQAAADSVQTEEAAPAPTCAESSDTSACCASEPCESETEEEEEAEVEAAEQDESEAVAETEEAQESASEPQIAVQATSNVTPMPNVQSAVGLSPTAADMQQKISNLQKQLAELARNKA